MATRTRRTPEQIAADYQRKANAARAKAAKLKKQQELNELIELGKLAKAQGLAGGGSPYEILGKAVVARASTDGVIMGSMKHFATLAALFADYVQPDEWAEFRKWWGDQGYPMG